jgi:predicted RNA polymerase sigma factor
MCFHAARLPARVDESGNLNALADQDRALWDRELIGEGLNFMALSAIGSELSEFHVEAAIAAIHGAARCTEATDWASIVSLYGTLMALRPSPVVALNRAIAIAQRDGPERGLEAINAIEDRGRLSSYPFYAAALGDLELRRGRHKTAKEHFQAALGQARNEMERQFLMRRATACDVQKT